MWMEKRGPQDRRGKHRLRIIKKLVSSRQYNYSRKVRSLIEDGNFDEEDMEQVAMETDEFGYKCQECGQGTVVAKLVPEYRTKIKGYPWTVQNARIGICDRCGAEHFDPNETLRWRIEFEEKQSYLTPAEIRELRQRLGLSREQFAILIGCTRQSLYHWEREDRLSPQSRMADLFMRLVRESHSRGPIDVLSFLTAQAASAGFSLPAMSR